MNKNRLFVASCVSLVTTSMVFAIRGDVAGPMSSAFQITNEQMGLIFSPAFWAFTISIFISGALVDVIGMRALHVLSAIGYFIGVGLVLVAPHPTAPVASIFSETGTTLLYAGFFVMGLSQGLVEGVINPLVATIYSDQKTKRLNMLHAWWPGGQVIGGLLAVAMSAFGASWQLKLITILIPAAIYLFMAFALEYPQTERVQSNVSTGDMWSEAAKPLFLLLFVCMWMTAAAELGPDQWFPKVMGDLVPQLQGVLFLVYTAGLMFLLRTFGSGIAHKNPIGTLFVCAILTGLGLYWLGGLKPGASATGRIRGGHAVRRRQELLLADDDRRDGGAVPARRRAADLADGRHRHALGRGGAAHHGLAHRPVRSRRGTADGAIVCVILTVIFGGLYMYFKARGGYRAIQLATDRPLPAGEM